MKILFGLFLIAHGLIHASYVSKQPPQKPGAPAWPFDLARSWLLTPLGVPARTVKALGAILAAATLAGFAASGLGWLGVPALKAIWAPVTAASSITSLLLLGLYWHYWLVLGIAIDAALLYFIFTNSLKPF